jgi:integrase
VSIHRSKSGKWQVRLRTPEGKNLQRTFTRKADAERFQRKQRLAIETGTWSNPSGAHLLLEEVYEQFGATKLGLKPKSIEANRSLWSFQIAPYFARRKVGSISIQEVHLWMKSATVGANAFTSSIRILKAFKLLASLMDYAVDMNYIPKNVLRKSNGKLNAISLPNTARRRTMLALTPEELLRFARRCGKYEALALVAGLCGLRWGEVVGLQVQDVDPNGKQIVVCRTISEVSGQYFAEDTKNHQARVVQVPQIMQEKLRLAVLGKAPHELVFGNKYGRPLSSSNFRARIFEPAILDAGIPRITFHDLRHTAASNAIALGANILVVSRMLGHSDPAVTLRFYGHLFKEDQLKLAQALHQRFASPQTEDAQM